MALLPLPMRPSLPVREEGPAALVNSDGSPNLASRAFQATAGSCELAYDLLSASEVEPTPGRVKHLGRILLEAADQIQMALRGTSMPDRCSYSHTRARGALRTVATSLPLPRGQGEGALRQWAEQVRQRAQGLLQAALDLYIEDL
jgi:hypothetical protein